MGIMSEQDRRFSRNVMAALGVLAVFVVPMVIILFLQSCEPRRPPLAIDREASTPPQLRGPVTH